MLCCELLFGANEGKSLVLLVSVTDRITLLFFIGSTYDIVLVSVFGGIV